MKYLPDCLASLEVLEEPFAICIVDNGSADGSVEWLKQYSCKKKKIQTIFSAGKYWILRSREHRNTADGYSLCPSVK